MSRLLAPAVCLLAGVAGVLGGAAAADASQGIGAGVGANPIVLSQPVHAGAVYALPSLYVVNTGSITATYVITLQRLPGQHGLIVPAKWVLIAPSQIRLTPGRSVYIGLKLSLPRRVADGRYRSGLVATAVLGRGGKSVATGAAAATDVRFSVSGGHARQNSAFPFAATLLVGIPVVAAGGWWIWHNRGYSVRVERRRRS